MKNFYITTDQRFEVTYRVQATSPEQAWALLIDADNSAVVNVEAMPAEITGSFSHADIMEGV